MSLGTIALLVLALLVLAAVVPPLLRLINRPPKVASFVADPDDDTVLDRTPAPCARSRARTSRCRGQSSIASGTRCHLEQLARTYWRFLTRCTLGLIRVSYTSEERFVVLVMRPFVLLRFQAPEYELDNERGVVRWRIERGVLVSGRGRGGDGYLKIDVQKLPPIGGAVGTIRVECEVANFYPMLASTISRWFYKNTQSRIHVIVTHGFLRSLCRLDLAPSRVGRFAGEDTLPG